jgi:hypothetical protein
MAAFLVKSQRSRRVLEWILIIAIAVLGIIATLASYYYASYYYGR